MKYNRGDYIRIHGLANRTDLNDQEGVIVQKVEDRYEVEIADTTTTFLLLPSKLKWLGQSCVVIGPCDKGISPDDLPIYTSYLKGPAEYEELKELKERFGWRSPTGMAWCTPTAKYKDLYIYYDTKSRETVNNLADVVFPAMSADKCCPSVPVAMPGRDGGIRGSIVVIRQEPPKFREFGSVGGKEWEREGQRDFPFDRLITHDEMRKMFIKARDAGPCSHGKGEPKKKPMKMTPQMDKMTEMAAKLGINCTFNDPNDIGMFLKSCQ